MSIEINRAWTVTGSGADYAGTNTIGNCNTSNLADDMKHTAYRAVRSLFWSGLWDWTDSSVTQEVMTLSRQAVDRGKDMIDNSFCWSGLGSESALSNLKYINYIGYRLGTESDRVEYKDTNTNTPWSFDIYLNYEPDESWVNLTYPLSNWRSSRKSYAKRYSFRNYNNTTDPNNQTDFWGYYDISYCSCNLYPIHKIALRNWINLIVVLAKPTVQSDRTTIRAFDLRSYCDSAHENYPIVIRVLLVPFMYSNNYQNYRTVTMSTGKNDRPHLSLSLYKQPSYAGKHIFTSDDDYDNIMWDSVWRSGSIVPPDSSGRSSSNSDDLQFRGNDNNNHNVAMTNYIMIMGMLTGCGNSSHGSGNISWGADYAEANLYALRFEDTLLIECGTDKWKEEEFTTNTDWLCFYREFDITFEEECKQQAACFGMFFTDRYTVAYNGELYDENMFLGKLDDKNIGHGEYENGYRNATLKQWDWTDSTDADYDPDYNPDPSFPEDYSGVVTKVPKEGIARGGKWYILNGSSYGTHFLEFLNDVSTSQAEIYQLEPIKCVISASIVMCPDFFGLPTYQDVGKINLGTVQFPESGVYSNLYAFADCYPDTYVSETQRVPELYHDFRDYEPYTKVCIYLPFAGNIDIPTNMVMNRHVHYEETIDPISGDLRYVIYIDGVPFTSATGNCSFNLDISANEASLYKQTQLGLQHQQAVGITNSVRGILGGTVGASIANSMDNTIGMMAQGLGVGVSIMQGIGDTMRIHEQMDATQPQPIQMAKTTSNCEYGDIILPCIAVTRPRMVDGYTDDYFRRTNGFETYIYDTIGNQKYFVKCSNAHVTGLSCTNEEINMIKKLLESGIYIKEE